jgi:hypothetical protein
MDLPYEPVIPLVVIYPKKMISAHQRHLCMPKVVAALSPPPKMWNQPRCPSMEKYGIKVWYINKHGIWSIHKKEWYPIICSKIDAARGH